MSAALDAPPLRPRKWRWAGYVALFVVAVMVSLWWLWDWNWFRPLVEARLSAALDRQVTIDRLELHPGRITALSIFGVTAGNQPGFDGENSATIGRVTIDFDAETWLRSRRIVLPSVELDRPDVNFEQNGNGKSNWDFTGSASSPPAEIGRLEIHDGLAHVRVAKEQADATVNISTQGDTLVVSGKGSYARQPVELRATGGAILALRDNAAPYPIDLQFDNGATRITLKGHVRDPLAFKGADVNLVLSGPDMELLLPLIGIATPKTPPYSVAGRLDFQNGHVK
jgi:hypothetical protein